MQRIMLKSKIHNAVITEANLLYEGSITLDSSLMDAADILEGERVQVVNLSNGARFETYAIRGGERTGIVCLNGPAARMGCVGDRVHILSWAVMTEEDARKYAPVCVKLDERNGIIRKKTVEQRELRGSSFK
jgi:aspartate 1-decarboxylase